MKRSYVVLFGLVAVLFFFAGCSKKSSNPPFYMRAKVGDKDYFVAGCKVFTSSGITIIDGFVPTSTTSTYPYITISLLYGLGVTGNISLDKNTGTYAEYHTSAAISMISESGSFYINSTTGNAVSGTFSFTCADGITVTDGEFSAERL